jgi:dephospho-CoA kinase
MKVIGVVGMPASGKGEFSRIAREAGIPVVVMGDMIRRTLAAEGLAPTDENLGAISRRLREELGRDAVAILTIPAVEAEGAPVVLIDGIRSDAEVALFKKHFEEFVLVGIDAPFAVRFARLRGRGRSDDPLLEEELRVRDERELGWGLGRALAMAEQTIENTGSIDSFEAAVRAFIASVGGGSCH